jgi:leukotriene-A4 hydrolase
VGEGDWGQPIARRIYAETRPGCHVVTQGSVDEIVNPAGLILPELASGWETTP